MKKKYEKREDVTMTDKLVERTVVKFDYDELFSVVLTDDELNALTADQLREALFAWSEIVSVARYADGTFTLTDYSEDEFDARIVNHPDGTFTVKEYQRKA